MSGENKLIQSHLIHDKLYTAGESFYYINTSNVNTFNNEWRISEFVELKRGISMRCVMVKDTKEKKTLSINKINKKNGYYITKDRDLADISYHSGYKNKDIK